jgi:hypothetical protein
MIGKQYLQNEKRYSKKVKKSINGIKLEITNIDVLPFSFHYQYFHQFFALVSRK